MAADPPPAGDAGFPLRQAIELIERAPAEAEALARSRLEVRPQDVDAATVLGAALRAQGRLPEALAVFEPLAKSPAASWSTLFELARLLVAMGRSREAVGPLERALAANPGLAAAWRLLGEIRLVAGDTAGAQQAFDNLLACVAPDPRVRAAARAVADGRAQSAEQEMRALLMREPALVPAAHVLAEALARRGELRSAEALLAHCADAAPHLNLARQSYALLLHRLGRPDAALAELDAVLVRVPGDARAMMAKAAALTEMDDYAAATEVTQALLQRFPDQPHAWLLYGTGLRTLGRIDAALDAWRRCLELDPTCAEAAWAMANLKDRPLEPQVRAMAEAGVDDLSLDGGARSLLGFTLGKALEDEGRDAEAFAAYARANALEHARRRYDPAAAHAAVAVVRATYTPAFFAERAGWGAAAADPIFVVGLPRSGSTLVEQILASHPEVEGTRELMDVQWMADWVAGRGGPASLTAAEARQLGLDYLARTRARRRLGRPRFIDKAPWNFQHAGLIRLMLPNARIVDVRRHPLACCVSAFRQHFASGFDFAYDLADLGRYYADYVALMAHFDAAMPGHVRRVIYEDLVADTEGEVRRLLADLGLPFDPACLRFFDNPRAVATPSSQQVRRPIYTEGLGAWRRFEPWLGPLKLALGPVLDTYPSAP